jgi:hypothetical protein
MAWHGMEWNGMEWNAFSGIPIDLEELENRMVTSILYGCVDKMMFICCSNLKL